MEYKKSIDGNHFYRIGENILHISYFKEDATFTKENGILITTIEVKKDDCCINTVPKIIDDVVDITEEEFDNKVREVISILGIYEFTERK